MSKYCDSTRPGAKCIKLCADSQLRHAKTKISLHMVFGRFSKLCVCLVLLYKCGSTGAQASFPFSKLYRNGCEMTQNIWLFIDTCACSYWAFLWEKRSKKKKLIFKAWCCISDVLHQDSCHSTLHNAKLWLFMVLEPIWHFYLYAIIAVIFQSSFLSIRRVING